MSTATARPVAMTIAGHDPSSGAGITADLGVFEAHGCFGVSAITALTVQATTGVRRVQATDAGLLAETLACLEEDLPPIGVKIGMLADELIVRAVVAYLRDARKRRDVHVVLDPVLMSSSGHALLNSAAVEVLQHELLPLVDVATPNIEELHMLSGVACDDEERIPAAMSAVACRFSGLTVVATGGHRPKPDDLLLHEGIFYALPGHRIHTKATHGTGCAFSSAMLAQQLRGKHVVQAAESAKRYVEGAMTHAETLGSGKGPMRLSWLTSQCIPA